MQHCEVVYHPKRPSLGGYNKGVVLNGQICDGHQRQVVLKRLPSGTVIVRHIHAVFCSGIQEAFLCRVFSEHSGEMLVRNTAANCGPSFSVV